MKPKRWKIPIYEDFLTIKAYLQQKLRVKVFEIGGTYLQGAFPERSDYITRDIFIVIATLTRFFIDPSILAITLAELSYSRNEEIRPHKEGNPLRFVSNDKKILDVFFRRVFMLELSNNMLSRVTEDRLCIEDIFLLKLQTSRDIGRDMQDLRYILQRVSPIRFSPSIIVEELKNQYANIVAFDRKEALNSFFLMFERVESLQDEFPNHISVLLLNEIERLLTKLEE